MTNEVSTKKKKRKKIMKVLAALMGVFLLIGCCSIGGLMFLGSDESAPLATTAPTSAPSLVVTTAANATNEAAMTTTPTLIPTSTPAPKPSATPTPPSEVSDYATEIYLLDMYALLVQYVETQEVVWELNTQASENPYLFLDSQWKADLTLGLNQLLTIGEKIRRLEPPQEFEETQGYLIKSTEHIDTFAYLYAAGVDTLDASLIVQAGEELVLAAEWMDKVNESIPSN